MDTNGVDVLSEDDCWQLLDATSVGRLAVDLAGQPDIFPINFVVHRRQLVFRTAAGTKLAGAVLMRHVAFEIDAVDLEQRTAWSVVVKGVAQAVERMPDVDALSELPLFPWIASPKPNFVQIVPRLVTGRRFHLVDEAPTTRPGREAVESTND